MNTVKHTFSTISSTLEIPILSESSHSAISNSLILCNPIGFDDFTLYFFPLDFPIVIKEQESIKYSVLLAADYELLVHKQTHGITKHMMPDFTIELEKNVLPDYKTSAEILIIVS